MHRIDGPGATVDNKFTDGDPVGGVPATVVTDDWLNDVQENLMALLSAAGVTPTKGRSLDVLDSIGKVTRGRLLRTTIFQMVGGVQQVSIDGGAFASTGATVFSTLSSTTKTAYKILGGGGSGGSAQGTAAGQQSVAGGGGAGGYCEGIFTSPLVAASVSVGAGGAAPAAGLTIGNNGGTSSVSGVASAAGGAGGAAGPLTSTFPLLSGGGNGGLASGANLVNTRGGSGGVGLNLALSNMASGAGANSILAGGAQAVGATQNGGSGGGPGAGGSGGACLASVAAGRAGGAGGDGYIEFKEYA